MVTEKPEWLDVDGEVVLSAVSILINYALELLADIPLARIQVPRFCTPRIKGSISVFELG